MGRRALAVHLALASLTVTAIVLAGPLNPPPGPISPTFKTLADVEPRTPISPATTPGDNSSVYVISQPGSYYLTGNVTAPADKIAISVTAPDVTIDLNGFTVSGGSTGIQGPAATVSAPITILNGTVRDAAGHGIDLLQAGMARVEKVQVLFCGSYGIATARSSGVIDCAVEGCGGSGIACGEAAIVQRCRAIQNGAMGIMVQGRGRVIDCVASSNAHSGVRAQGVGCLVTGTTSSYNDQSGFLLGAFTTIEDCTAYGNQSLGIGADAHSTVRQCRALSNRYQGIVVTDYCTVVGNAARGNGSGNPANIAGIWLNGIGSRAESNESAGNDYGIFISGTDNLVVRNSCSANPAGNYHTIGGNELAPIVTNPGSSNFSTATEWSNFAY